MRPVQLRVLYFCAASVCGGQPFQYSLPGFLCSGAGRFLLPASATIVLFDEFVLQIVCKPFGNTLHQFRILLIFVSYNDKLWRYFHFLNEYLKSNRLRSYSFQVTICKVVLAFGLGVFYPLCFSYHTVSSRSKLSLLFSILCQMM